MEDFLKYPYYQGCLNGQVMSIEVLDGAFTTADRYAAANIRDLLNCRENESWIVSGDAPHYYIYNQLLIL